MEDQCKISRWEIFKRQLNNLPPKEFKESLENNPNGILIDCRRPFEFETGYLPNATNLNYLGDTFYDELEMLNPKGIYFVYCRSSRRSIRTCTLMKNSGFENIYNLEGGLNEWTKIFGDSSLVRRD